MRRIHDYYYASCKRLVKENFHLVHGTGPYASRNILFMPIRYKKKGKRRRHFLKAWRLYRGFTQQYMVDHMGTSTATISRTENGITPYNQDFVEDWADLVFSDVASILSVYPGPPKTGIVQPPTLPRPSARKPLPKPN